MLGCAAAVIALVATALLAFGWPRPTLDGAPILLGRSSGALYVRVGAVLHPVLNLASARLIAGADAEPRPVRDADLGRAARGPMLGIPGAPGVLGAALPETAAWSVCDGPTGTTVLAAADVAQTDRIADERAVPVTAGEHTYLLHRGRRIPVNPAGLDQRWVSPLLLNAVPEAPPAQASAPITVLPVAGTTLCVHVVAQADGGETTVLSAGAGLPLPAGQAPTALAQADGDGPALDAVYLPPGRSGYVRSDSGERYLVADTGVRYPIADAAAARSLGLPAVAARVPWPVLAGLPAGPELSRPRALVARDVIGTPTPGR